MKTYKFSELRNCNLIVDSIYEGFRSELKGEPLCKIFPTQNLGGFRKVGKINKLKYIILYTSGEDLDWPDSIDTETGIFILNAGQLKKYLNADW